MFVSTGRRGAIGPTCVVVGLHQNGLGVARALGRRGVHVIAVDGVQRDQYSATRFATRVVCPDLRGPQLIDTLRQIGRSLSQPGVLILTLDRSVQLVSEFRSAIEPYFTHSLPEDDVIRRLMNKAEIERFATEHGFKVPRTFAITSEDDLDECIADIPLPCVLKPQVKTVEFVERSPKKAFFIRTREELCDTWQMVAQWEPGVVVQEWIPGPDTRLVFSLFYCNREGTPLATFTGRKVRQFIPRCGTACSAEPWHDEVVRDAGVRFFRTAHYTGFGAIEFKIDPNGQYHLTEPTVGRTEHLFALAAANGVDLPYLGYCDMAGLPKPAIAERPRRVVYVDWKRDRRAARALIAEGELTWSSWLSTLGRRRQLAVFAWDDPMPFLRGLALRAASKATRVFERAGSSAATTIDRVRVRCGGLRQLGAARRPREEDLSAHLHLDSVLEWLCAAQDATGGGGVARGYAVSRRSRHPVGWEPAYPETTGYIIPTMFDCARFLGRGDLARRACRMADWEVSVQLSCGGFPGGTVDRPWGPVVFNTGMVLLGLTRAYAETRSPAYRDAIVRAASFLVQSQSQDGAWRRFSNAWRHTSSQASISGRVQVHAYDCLVSWPLLVASRLLGKDSWADAAVRNLKYTMTLQAPNGWFAANGFRPPNDRALTHTIGYVTAGLLEAGVLSDCARFVDAAEHTARAVLDRLDPDGFLPGEFDARWQAAASWSCLTGTAQMAIVWWRLFELRGDARYAEAARRATHYVMHRHEVARGPVGVRGGVAGSFPVQGAYGRFQFLNWAAKFFADTLLFLMRHDGANTEPGAACMLALRDPATV